MLTKLDAEMRAVPSARKRGKWSCSFTYTIQPHGSALYFSTSSFLYPLLGKKPERRNMKRDNRGAPVMMVHRWNRPPLSCQPCRAKKRRCDRNQPCSNCSQRNINCEYVSFSQTDEAPGPTTLQQAPPTSLDPTPSLLTATTPSESALYGLFSRHITLLWSTNPY